MSICYFNKYDNRVLSGQGREQDGADLHVPIFDEAASLKNQQKEQAVDRKTSFGEAPP